MIFFHLDNLF